MSYCKPNVQATIKYSFANKKDIFITRKTPIDIEVTSSIKQTKDCELYNVLIEQTNYSPSGEDSSTFSVTCFGPIGAVEFYIYETSSDGTVRSGASRIQCRGVYRGAPVGHNANTCMDYNWYPLALGAGLFKGFDIALKTLSITRYDNQPAPNQICTIKISHDSKLLFQDIGDCPCIFDVACGQECPEGFCKIDCPEYPGYCCISCAEMEALLLKLKS